MKNIENYLPDNAIEIIEKRISEKISLNDIPENGIVAGQALASIIMEMVWGRSGPINDIDVFIKSDEKTISPLDTKAQSSRWSGLTSPTTTPNAIKLETKIREYRGSGGSYFSEELGKESHGFEDRGIEPYNVINTKYIDNLNITTLEFNKNQNNVSLYSDDNKETFIDFQKSIINGFDINCVEISYNPKTKELQSTKEFIEFLDTKEIKVTSTHTPAHTLNRIAKKESEMYWLNVNQSEYDLLLDAFSVDENGTPLLTKHDPIPYSKNCHLLFTKNTANKVKEYVDNVNKTVIFSYIGEWTPTGDTKDNLDLFTLVSPNSKDQTNFYALHHSSISNKTMPKLLRARKNNEISEFVFDKIMYNNEAQVVASINPQLFINSSEQESKNIIQTISNNPWLSPAFAKANEIQAQKIINAFNQIKDDDNKEFKILKDCFEDTGFALKDFVNAITSKEGIFTVFKKLNNVKELIDYTKQGNLDEINHLLNEKNTDPKLIIDPEIDLVSTAIKSNNSYESGDIIKTFDNQGLDILGEDNKYLNIAIEYGNINAVDAICTLYPERVNYTKAIKTAGRLEIPWDEGDVANRIIEMIKMKESETIEKAAYSIKNLPKSKAKVRI